MKDWNGNKTSTYVNIGASNHSLKPREVNDYYSTDPVAIDYLLQYETFNTNIWECACGNGNLSERLKKYNYNVTSTDLYDRNYGESGVDFLKQKDSFNGDIITNPPYKYATEFVLKALELTKQKVGMFLKIQFLESQKRYKELFSKHPPNTVYVFVKRISCYPNNDMNKNKSSAVSYAWYIWDKEESEETRIKWINNIQPYTYDCTYYMI